jgi:hypothetical protein
VTPAVHDAGVTTPAGDRTGVLVVRARSVGEPPQLAARLTGRLDVTRRETMRATAAGVDEIRAAVRSRLETFEREERRSAGRRVSG